ncbi:hypothetical protein VP01_5855g1 [Puccinia sorghi]|uniref:Reverse transcriptase Ty1/copia-type domain-containing protein n=1 Tax=Puccinia sorghi TaxID=27349 RepID=A0A0L6UI32_9BASI|nr:hypothetical protein VP01_5855g1 [Puccinia sorghi]
MLLGKYNVQFNINQFTVLKGNEIILEGNYHHSLPILKLKRAKHHSHLSEAEIIHKSLGHKQKLDPRGDLGRLIGFDTKLKSQKIFMNDGKLVNSKNVNFLDFNSLSESEGHHDELVLKERPTNPSTPTTVNCEAKHVLVKEEDCEERSPLEEPVDFDPAKEQSSEGEDDNIAEALVPVATNPIGRILQERTLQVKPKAVSGENSEEWIKAINHKLHTIEHHDVWIDQWETPSKFFNGTWVFKKKPATNSSPEKEVQFCIQGLLQTYSKDYFEMFSPGGKFPSLLTLLVVAIDLNLPIKQFDIKSPFLFVPLEEEIFIKTPEGSKLTAPFLKVVRSLWFKEINYTPSTSDACLLIHREKNSFIFFHIDDLIVVGQTEEFNTLFLDRFPNSSAHDPDTLLGMNGSVHEDLVW